MIFKDNFWHRLAFLHKILEIGSTVSIRFLFFFALFNRFSIVKSFFRSISNIRSFNVFFDQFVDNRSFEKYFSNYFLYFEFFSNYFFEFFFATFRLRVWLLCVHLMKRWLLLSWWPGHTKNIDSMKKLTIVKWTKLTLGQCFKIYNYYATLGLMTFLL